MTRTMKTDTLKAAAILIAIAASEATWVAFTLRASGNRFWRYMGFVDPGRAGVAAWVLAVIVAMLFVSRTSASLPSVREHLFRPSGLKVLALLVAITAALCEEAIFRKLLMDALQRHGSSVITQVLASAVAFGLAHGVWGAIRGSARAAAGAIFTTGLVGGALAAVYIAGHRVLAPCVLSHFLINVLAEPGLVLAAVRGEMDQFSHR